MFLRLLGFWRLYKDTFIRKWTKCAYSVIAGKTSEGSRTSKTTSLTNETRKKRTDSMYSEQRKVVPRKCPACGSARLRVRHGAGVVFFKCDKCRMKHHG